MKRSSKELEMLDPEAWEALCVRCGRCCYEKLDFNGLIFYTRKPCDQLDLETHQCRIYPQRDQIRPDCRRLTPDVVAAGFLPADCPYARRIKNYRAPNLGAAK